MSGGTADRTVLLAGATGLVGGLALRRLLAGSDFEQVVVVARRPLGEAHPRLRVIVTELDRLESMAPVPARAALCALGTTIRKAGSEDAFRAVDLQGVLAFASWARRGGARCFALVSSVGASPDSANFYLRVKGEAEQAVAGLGYDRFVALRPSVLLGARGETRPLEAVSRAVMPGINWALRGRMRRYRGIGADVVAAGLVAAGRGEGEGKEVWEYEEIVSEAGGGA